jgi:hypothetical protein
VSTETTKRRNPPQRTSSSVVSFNHPLYRAPVGFRLAGFSNKVAACGRGPLGPLLTGGLLVRTFALYLKFVALRAGGSSKF